jgi:hypothetical protein
MRWLLSMGSVVLTVGILAGQNGVPLSGIGRNVLTNQGVAMLARAGYSEGFIIDMIYHKQTQFDVSTDGLVWLAKEGLSERIVRTMVTNERKQEMTAIEPASIIFTPISSPTADREQKPANVAFRVSFPTPVASKSSENVKGWERDRWYVVPNVPALTVPVVK